VRQLAEEGLTLAEALRERWPETEYASWPSFVERKRRAWPGVADDRLRSLYERYERRWSEEVAGEAGSAAALVELCARRIAALERTLE
jgi:hypothetical protein